MPHRPQISGAGHQKQSKGFNNRSTTLSSTRKIPISICPR